jgi:hypothetical protein
LALLGGTVTDTITANGKPLSNVSVSETNVNTLTVNGTVIPRPTKAGSDATNKAGQLPDIVGAYAPAGTQSQNAALVHALTTNAVTFTNVNTIKFTVPGGATYAATATRTLTNGNGGSQYTLTTTQPAVAIVPQ